MEFISGIRPHHIPVGAGESSGWLSAVLMQHMSPWGIRALHSQPHVLHGLMEKWGACYRFRGYREVFRLTKCLFYNDLQNILSDTCYLCAAYIEFSRYVWDG